MKPIIESNQEIVSSDSLGEYMMTIHQAITDETDAIAFYDNMLKLKRLPVSVRSIIEEIRDDEKDHLVLLTSLFQDEVSETFPEFGDDNSDSIDESEEE